MALRMLGGGLLILSTMHRRYTWARRCIVYCPQCGVEYRAGSTECSDCLVPLRDGTPPPEPGSPFDPALDLVVVLETNDPIQLAFAKRSLEDAGIPFFVLGQIATLITDVDPFLHKWARLQVPGDRETEARELLETLGEEVAGDSSENA